MAATTEHDGASVPAVEEMSYTEASDELDEIVRFFEDRDVDVDQLVGRLVRATAIIEELDKRLRRTRVQVEQLVPKLTKVLSADGQLDDDVHEDLGDATGATDEADDATGATDEADDVTGATDEADDVDDELTAEADDEALGALQEAVPSSRARRAGADTAALF